MDTDLEERMHSVLDSREKLEAINAQLQQQNQFLQEQVALLRQQVNQVQAPQTPTAGIGEYVHIPQHICSGSRFVNVEPVRPKQPHGLQ